MQHICPERARCRLSSWTQVFVNQCAASHFRLRSQRAGTWLKGGAMSKRRILTIACVAGAAVLPLVLATGAGANARKSIGISVSTGMLASTCLAVVFVPCFFVVMQRFEEWLSGRKVSTATDLV